MGPLSDAEMACLVALAGLPHVGPGTLRRCLELGGPVSAWTALVAGRADRTPAFAPLRRQFGGPAMEALAGAARSADPDAELRRNRADGRWMCVRGGPGYPAVLDQDPAPPVLLFGEGDPRVLARPMVAVVGTRSATRLGRDLASALGRDLAEAGVSVVSGLASGIDGAAHRGALGVSSAGRTVDVPSPGAPVGVIASGLDIAYPHRHRELHREVAARGVLLSEAPAGKRPDRWRFPARNRIIAGLSCAVVVVESRSSGGSMLTAAEALDRGVPVLAMPGHPLAPNAAGTNDLIFDGATPCRGVDDVLGVIGVERPSAARDGGGEQMHQVGAAGRQVLDALEGGPSALEQLLIQTGLDLGQITRALVDLEAGGLVDVSDGWYQATASGVGGGFGRRRGTS